METRLPPAINTSRSAIAPSGDNFPGSAPLTKALSPYTSGGEDTPC
jgi:hypothetical protein